MCRASRGRWNFEDICSGLAGNPLSHVSCPSRIRQTICLFVESVVWFVGWTVRSLDVRSFVGSLGNVSVHWLVCNFVHSLFHSSVCLSIMPIFWSAHVYPVLSVCPMRPPVRLAVADLCLSVQ